MQLNCSDTFIHLSIKSKCSPFPGNACLIATCKFLQMREQRDKWLHCVRVWQLAARRDMCRMPLPHVWAFIYHRLISTLPPWSVEQSRDRHQHHMPDAVGFWLVESNKINESFMVFHISLCNCFQETSGISLCRAVSGLTLMDCDTAHLWTPQPVLPYHCQTSGDKWQKKAVVFPTWVDIFLLSPNKTTQVKALVKVNLKHLAGPY